MQKQADYHCADTPASMLLPLGTEGREQYAARRENGSGWTTCRRSGRDWPVQTRRYEDIFKNEFVLTILKSCERARADLKQINGELAEAALFGQIPV